MGDTFTEILTVIDEWNTSEEKFRLINRGCGPDVLQIWDEYKKEWREESLCYIHGVLCNRIKALKRW